MRIKLNKSFTNIAIVGAGNGINALFGLLFFTAVARTLTLEDFGRYALLTSTLVFLPKIMDFGTNSIFVAKSIAKKEHVLGSLVALRKILFFVTIVASLIILGIIGILDANIVTIFLLGVIGYGINITLFAYFQSVEKFTHAVLVNTLPAIIKLTAAIAVFSKLFLPNLETAFGIFAISIMSSILLVPLLPKHLRKFNLKAPTKDIVNFFKESTPAGVALLITQGWPAFTNFIAKLTSEFVGTGIFSLANKIADIFSLISLSIFTVLLPKNARRKSNHQGYDLRETALLAGGILVLAIIAIIGSQLFTIQIFGEKFRESLGLLNILIFSSGLLAIASFMENYFFVEEKTNILLKITLSRLATFSLIAVTLIPTMQLTGLAFASLGASLVALALSLREIQGA